MTSGQYTLFDLPSKPPCKCWSYNPWKTRMLLNYKGLDYKTEWVEYPDIKPKFESHVPANAQGAAYSIPVLKFPDGLYTMDSRKIVSRIEELHPSPPVHLESPYLAKVEEILPKIMQQLYPAFMAKMPRVLLNEASHAYWNRTREARAGMPLDQYEREQGGDLAYSKAAPFVNQVGELLKEKKEGPFFEGDQVTYTDLVWASFLHFLQRIGDDMFDGVLGKSADKNTHLAILKACQPWLERDDH